MPPKIKGRDSKVSAKKKDQPKDVRSKAWLAFLSLAVQKSWAAAAVTGAATAVTASATSMVLGNNVWPWAIGGFGAAIVYFKKHTIGPIDVIVNSIISIAIGGFVAPLAASVLAYYTSPALNNPYAMAFVLSTIWPFVVPICMQLLGAVKIRVEDND